MHRDIYNGTWSCYLPITHLLISFGWPDPRASELTLDFIGGINQLEFTSGNY
jgi:hypothetical protein